MSELMMKLVKMLVGLIVEMLTPEKAKELIDKAFDKLEAEILDSETHWDDVLLIPIIKGLRVALGVPQDKAIDSSTPDDVTLG